MRPLSVAVLLGLLSLFGGCVAIESSMLNEHGIVYFLPKSMLTITVVQYKDNGNGRTWYQIGGKPVANSNAALAGSLDLTQVEIQSTEIPDPDHRYVASYRPSATSDDRLCIARSTVGLLAEVDFASDDRTPAIAVNIARAIAAALPAPTGISSIGTPTNNVEVRSYTGRIDPTRRRDREVFNNALIEAFGENLEIDFSRMKQIFDKHTAPLPTNCRRDGECGPQAFTDRCTKESICYRTALWVPIDLRRNGRTVDVNYASVINPNDVGAISITRAFLVHKISKFKFNNGMLTAALVRKPSEAEAVSLLPLQVVYAALATPSGAFSNAFGGGAAANVKLAQQYTDLSSKIASLQSNEKQLQAALTGVGPSFSNEQYNWDCTSSASGGFIAKIGG